MNNSWHEADNRQRTELQVKQHITDTKEGEVTANFDSTHWLHTANRDEAPLWLTSMWISNFWSLLTMTLMIETVSLQNIVSKLSTDTAGCPWGFYSTHSLWKFKILYCWYLFLRVCIYDKLYMHTYYDSASTTSKQKSAPQTTEHEKHTECK